MQIYFLLEMLASSWSCFYLWHFSCLKFQNALDNNLFLLIALSAEEERLWSIVRANSLDFGAWTALIEEAEKMSEVCFTDLTIVTQLPVLVAWPSQPPPNLNKHN